MQRLTKKVHAVKSNALALGTGRDRGPPPSGWSDGRGNKGHCSGSPWLRGWTLDPLPTPPCSLCVPGSSSFVEDSLLNEHLLGYTSLKQK